MTAFRFIPITPHPLLGPYVAKIWVFESTGRLPSQERKLIVPNANLKLTLSYRNGIAARVGNKAFLQRENELTLTGLIDTPVILDPHDDTQTGTVIIEFNPLGAYRLFHLSFAEVTNQIAGMTDLFGSSAEQLRVRLTDTGDVDGKLKLLQDFLIRHLETTAQDTIYDYCINRITYTKGLISVTQLEKETGYSARWLQRKFSGHLGTGPKEPGRDRSLQTILPGIFHRGAVRRIETVYLSLLPRPIPFHQGFQTVYRHYPHRAAEKHE